VSSLFFPHRSEDYQARPRKEDTPTVAVGGFQAMADRLARMRANPRDWSIGDVAALCREYGVDCLPPSGGGSHWKVSDPSQSDILTVANHRPVKPVYIRKLVRFIEQVQKARHGKS
jgi:hypothetical protein